MKYVNIWAKPQQHFSKVLESQGLRGRVKDWPADAQAAFKDLKNQLWKWSKKHEAGGQRQGLGLIAYMGVKAAWEDTPPKTTINCETEEDTWSTILNLSRK